ncbi:MAG TPA: 1,4-alpha-glucan branching protein domain-containing protein [Dehalococcoidia bacterium]|nr:1,4-alpha-glucan branching protein domain-containing protein [Dehalococcoidia bacterium]
MKQGAFTFVLHSHLPYARKAGRWPHGEEWLHEGAVDTYLPLLAALHDLAAEGVRYRLTISITPVLAEQLADADVLGHLDAYIDDLCDRAASDIARSERNGDDARADVARFYHGRFTWLRDQFRDRFGRDIVGALRWLQDNGYVEIATSAATHGYLPLLERDSSIYAQVRTGVRTYRRHFGRAPASFWLPECAYRAAHEDGGVMRPGLEEFLAAQRITAFFVESHAILGGQPLGKAAGDAIGPYGEPRRYTVPGPAGAPTHRTTFQPYWVARPQVAAIGRNVDTGLQVWSGEHGYPGDFVYREFHKKDDQSGLHYWRVTGARVALGDKQLYGPAAAFDRARDHARHFAALVGDQVRAYRASSGRYGIVSAAYDTELLGHWWYEGVTWLQHVLRDLSRSDAVDMTGAAQFVREHPPEDVVTLPESSWGRLGTHVTWLNDDTAWMWPVVRAAERRMEQLVAGHGAASGDAGAALAQLGRELLLLQSSDWPFLVTTGQAREYAEQRFRAHADRFGVLADAVDAGRVDRRQLDEIAELDKLFPDLDIADFTARQGVAAAPLGAGA